MHRHLSASVLLTMTLLFGGCGGSEPDGSAANQTAVPAASETVATAQLVRVDFNVEGMDCGGCVIGTRAALQKLEGVEEADASYEDATGRGAAWALYDPTKVTPERMMTAIRELGYTPTRVEAEAEG